MRYIWESGKKRSVMHIAKYTKTGEMLFEAVCGIKQEFNRSINAPFTFGKRVCKNCLKEK